MNHGEALANKDNFQFKVSKNWELVKIGTKFCKSYRFLSLSGEWMKTNASVGQTIDNTWQPIIRRIKKKTNNLKNNKIIWRDIEYTIPKNCKFLEVGAKIENGDFYLKDDGSIENYHLVIIKMESLIKDYYVYPSFRPIANENKDIKPEIKEKQIKNNDIVNNNITDFKVGDIFVLKSKLGYISSVFIIPHGWCHNEERFNISGLNKKFKNYSNYPGGATKEELLEYLNNFNHTLAGNIADKIEASFELAVSKIQENK